jgi:hypothetical protein
MDGDTLHIVTKASYATDQPHACLLRQWCRPHPGGEVKLTVRSRLWLLLSGNVCHLPKNSLKASFLSH